jgi:hypothetical protein
MLSDLLAIMGTLEYEHQGYIRLICAIEQGKDIELSIKLSTGVECTPPQFWKIYCQSVQEHQLIFGEIPYPFGIYNEHVLLWPHEDCQISLSFYGKVKDIFGVVGRLYVTHMELVGQYIPFQRYFNHDLVKLLASGYGVLAEGPERLVKAYQEVMDEFGFKTSVIPTRRSYCISGKYIVPQGKGQSVLIMGDSYIIATHISISKDNTRILDRRIEMIYEFICGNIAVRNFEEWVYSENSLESLLGELLYFEIISASYSDEVSISKIKQILSEFLTLQFV